MNAVYNRYLGAIVLLPLAIFLFIGGNHLKFLVLILSLVGLYEFYGILKKKDYHTFNYLAYAFVIIYFLYLDKLTTDYFLFIVVLFICICLSIPVFQLKHNFIESALTIFGFLYVPLLFSLIPKIEMKDFGQYFTWLVFICSWGSDTFAYYSGRLFGKNKLCPNVSPKKTIEGSIGGLIGSVVGCCVYGVIINKFGVHINLYHYFIIGLIGGILGQIGDLVASIIKRYLNVKDYGNIIPGHGGILDRFDSILFVSAAIYFYITLIIKL
ncbi:phosphatidate cytidylyltransferase [Hathewaya histolytica]|uniref:Phosphatidate cytidylyltransferase n=1 Tax=Hathewaya histolytica TaxID=1498 RepID=A0A4V6KF41_HATHI|nr:phosphatidate cytidylyltransferase [Hathewaya histolytica]VTQ89587.1 CDP-diglyceride synthetase [Hathewaya histolytica]